MRRLNYCMGEYKGRSDNMKILRIAVLLLCLMKIPAIAMDPAGFNNAPWGSAPDKVKTAVTATGWVSDPVSAKGFPAQMNVLVFGSTDTIAGYRAAVKYYFYENKLFQATVIFNFDDLKKFDFNYNVFRSVNEYYNFIRSKTIVFVNDIYSLLCQKYGKKEPIFKGLDPRYMFVDLDKYLNRERWNLRYHPYDYFVHMTTAAYARWDFPKTRVLFSMAIDAKEKRFDYQLSLASLDMERAIQKKMTELRTKGL